ncbi:MAG: aminopeptidase [Anaerofustis stercorihominis]|nr:aminopeptidase [Anaerofustis stercorihominis]
MDSRITKLAYNLVNISLKIKEGEHVLINVIGNDTMDMAKALIKEVYKVGAYPHMEISDRSISRELLMGYTKEQLDTMCDYQLYRMKMMDAYIGVSSSDNMYELSDVPSEKMNMSNLILNPVLRERVDNTRWVILRWPNGSSAQSAKMSKEAFEDYFFDVCCLDYDKMSRAMQPLVELMNRTDKVHIVGEGTDLTFSIKGLPAIECSGQCNIPDGEIFTAPVRDSVNGVISFNTQSMEDGFVFENICLKFKDGKIIEATANNTEKINEILDTDEGARYVGEFAIGVNPYVTKPILDTLFDEKIAGSFHFTPGAAYEEADNGNSSAVHWDLVCIQSEEYPGKIYFDDVLIRENGIFVPEELKGLNPENLK